MRRILFIKTSSLGDVVHHCPAVSDAARHAPGALIDWMVEEPFAGVAAMHCAVRRVIPVAVRRWRAALWNPAVWREIGALRRALGAERYDCVIDSQGLVKSALLGRLASGARHGMDRASAREPFAAFFYEVRHVVPRARHAVERNRLLTAAALGYAPDTACDFGLRAEGPPPIAAGDSTAVFLTMSSRAEKLWPEANWIGLGRALGSRLVLPWGSEAERLRCERIAAATGNALVPRALSLEELARLFRGARVVAGVDTGLTHLAAALGVPTIGIYCGSDPALTGLYGSPLAKNLGAPGRPASVAEVRGAIE